MKTSLDHLPETKRAELAFVVEVIRDGFAFAIARRTMPDLRGGQLLKIILFGSYARGDWVEDPVGRYFSDYDLLVVVGCKPAQRHEADLLDKTLANRHSQKLATILITPDMPSQLEAELGTVDPDANYWSRIFGLMYETSLVAM